MGCHLLAYRPKTRHQPGLNTELCKGEPSWTFRLASLRLKYPIHGTDAGREREAHESRACF